MKLKDRIKTYNFWVSLSSAIFILIKLLGEQFGFSVNESVFNDFITTLCGILVILGIIVPPTAKDNSSTVTTGTSSAQSQDYSTISDSNSSTLTNDEISADENPVIDNVEESINIESEATQSNNVESFNKSNIIENEKKSLEQTMQSDNENKINAENLSSENQEVFDGVTLTDENKDTNSETSNDLSSAATLNEIQLAQDNINENQTTQSEQII